MKIFKHTVIMIAKILGIHIVAASIVSMLLLGTIDAPYAGITISILGFVSSLFLYIYLGVWANKYLFKHELDSYVFVLPLFSILAVGWFIWRLCYLYDSPSFIQDLQWIFYYGYNALYLPFGMFFFPKDAFWSVGTLLFPVYPTFIIYMGFLGNRASHRKRV